MNNAYTYSEHYRKDPFDEIDAARHEGKNTLDSIQTTLEARLDNEQRRTPQDAEAIERINNQLAYLGSLATTQELEAA